MKRGRRAEDNQQRSAGNAGSSFTADQKRQNHQELLPDAEVQSRSLNRKKQSQGLIEAGAVQIEAVAGRKNEGDNFTAHTEGLELLHGAGECGFGACRGESESDGLSNRFCKPFDGDAYPQQNRHQNANYEKKEGGIHRQQKL